MSTRATAVILDENEKVLFQLYVRQDGHTVGFGDELKNACCTTLGANVGREALALLRTLSVHDDGHLRELEMVPEGDLDVEEFHYIVKHGGADGGWTIACMYEHRRIQKIIIDGRGGMEVLVT